MKKLVLGIVISLFLVGEGRGQDGTIYSPPPQPAPWEHYYHWEIGPDRDYPFPQPKEKECYWEFSWQPIHLGEAVEKTGEWEPFSFGIITDGRGIKHDVIWLRRKVCE